MWTRLFIMTAVGLSLLSASASSQTLPEDPVSQARAMAFAGKRDDALRVLAEYLDTYPDDTNARTLFGTVLSWQGEYEEARVQLQTVLDGNPTHGDALPALVNVELWSDHPERAASMAAVGLAENPTSSALLVTRARALWNLSREREALDVLNEALAHDPANETALRLRRTLRDTQQFWRADVAYAYDSFSDGRAAWRETRYSITRQTRIGSVIGRFYHAKRFGLSDRQVEVEMYPRFREGTYAYVSGAFAPNPVLFPGYRVGVDLYQSLGAGFEVSAGFRRLQFEDAVTIYVGSLTKYTGHWMLTGRVFATPSARGTSTSAHGIVRRYWPNGLGYIGVRYGRGAYRDEVRSTTDLLLLNSDTVAAEFVLPIGALELWVSTTASREGRAARSDLWQISTSSGLGIRF